MISLRTGTATCRSYRQGSFDGCPGCVDAALDAVAQSGLYVLAHVVPGIDRPIAGPAELAYRLRIRLEDDSGNDIGEDDLDVDQTVGEAAAFADSPPSGADAGVAGSASSSSMRLEDFQTVLDRLELQPVEGTVSGAIGGSLFGYSRLIGRFEIVIGPRC